MTESINHLHEESPHARSAAPPEDSGEFARLHAEALKREQGVLDTLYGRLDELRDAAAAELATVRATKAEGTHQSRSERDAFATLFERRLRQLNDVEERLCFGRLDLVDGESRYIGRVGLADADQSRLLVDWRASAATPFYQATAAHPDGVVLRRHLVTHRRTVTGIEDDVLDLEALDDAGTAHLAGEGALLAALNAQRTGRMGDIVATIQAEQDLIIRSDPAGVLVVEGGPGTGKTAVALHRAAYLLYAQRERLSRSGVLVVGPSSVFLRYIERVLPSLGETGVVMMTTGELFPGVNATITDAPAAAALKGQLRMAQAIANAVADRQRVPTEPARLDVEGTTVVLTPRAVQGARDRARSTGKPHNEARVGFVKDLLNHLADLMTEQLGSRLAPEDRALIIADLRASPDVRRALNLAWMPLSATDVVDRLLSDPRRLRSAAPWLTPEQVEALIRPRGSEFTVDDVPLLDEAAEAIGVDDSAAQALARAAEKQREADLDYAKSVLSMTGTGWMVSQEMLADRFAVAEDALTVSERAAEDRTWAFGHVVVDEAQELSPMQWRVLGRRNPGRSMTVVGDLAQTRSVAGADDWAAVLHQLVEDRWRKERLTVSYRTPAQVMRVAAAVLAAAGSTVQAPTSVREGDDPPLATRVPDPADWADTLARVVQAEAAAVEGGRLAVICPDSLLDDAAASLAANLDASRFGTGAMALDREVALITPAQAKGLEFDGVVLVEPADILSQGPRGLGDLYVALTRPTRRLHVVHTHALPAGMEAVRRSAG